MKKILTLFFFISTFIIITFLLFQDAESYMVAKLDQPENAIIFSALSFLFLLSDILMPIPSSLILILNGKILGFFGGTLLGFTAGISSSSIGFYLGRASSKYINRFFKPTEVDRANAFMNKYGKLSIALSRAIPILSETVALMSGNSNLSFTAFISYAAIGHLVVSLVYAWVGAFAASADGYLVSFIVIAATLLIALVFGKITTSKLTKRSA